MKTYFIILVFALIGCSPYTTGVVPMDKDTYMVSDYGGSIERAKASVYSDANKFCTKQNKKVETVSLKITAKTGAFSNNPTDRAEILFRCIDANSLDSKTATSTRDAENSLKATIISDVDNLPSVKFRSNPKAYAIVIGIEQYRQKLPRADYATRDAQTVMEYLTQVLGYPEENVITLLNDRALKSDIEKYFEKWLGNNVEQDGTVFVFYSGHGAPNPKTADAYIVPYDGDPSFIDETGYSLRRMYAALGKLPAKEIIVALDSCFSGAGGRSVIAKGSRPLVMNLQANTVIPTNMTVLSASAGDQASSTYDEKGHGLFTYFMLKGIKNEDVVRRDGSIKVNDLYSYVKPQVERIARKQYNNEQTPQLTGSRKN